MTPSSGARSGTKPSRSERGAGDGRIGARKLSCGHETHAEHIVSGPRGKLYRCPDGCGLRIAEAGGVSLVKFHARNHPHQVGRRGADPRIDNRATTPEVFGPLHGRFGFNLDVAADARNTKVPRYFSIEDDGLAQSWGGARVWCNPPYSNIGPWLHKAWEEHERAELIVLLLPANRTEQAWWQEYVEPYRDRPGSPLRVEFLRGRLRFIADGKSEVGPNERPPFGCCLCIWETT